MKQYLIAFLFGVGLVACCLVFFLIGKGTGWQKGYEAAMNEPYKTNTIELNLPTLTGKVNGEGESVVIAADGLKSAGSVYDEGIVENGSVPTTAPHAMSVTYAIDAAGILTGLPQNYVSKESLQAMLTAMQSAGLFSSYTMTFNSSTGKYEFTFTPNA